MFTNLRVGAKPCILRATFIISNVVTICALVREKQIAIELACRKFTRARYLATVRESYAMTFARQAEAAMLPRRRRPADGVPKALVDTDADAADRLRTVELEQGLESLLRQLRADQVAAANAIVGDIPTRAWTACSCIGDDSILSSATDANDEVEATGTVTDRLQSLSAKLAIVPMTAHDSPSGSDREKVEHILRAFLTTRSNDVCMGLLICCSIIKVREDRLSGVEGELVFQVALPVGKFGSTQ